MIGAVARVALAWLATYVLAFGLAELAPGTMGERAARAAARLPDDARAPAARAAIVERVEREHELGGGAVVRMGRVSVRAVTLDLGRSWRDGRPVGEVIGPGLGGTGGRALMALVVAVVLGMAAGLGGAVLGAGDPRSFGAEHSFGGAEHSFGGVERSFGGVERSFGRSERPFGRRAGGTTLGVVVALALAMPVVWLCHLALAASVSAAGSGTVAVMVLALAPAAVIAAHAQAAVEEMLRSPLAAAIRARGAGEGRLVWVHGARLVAPRLAPLAASTVGFVLGAAPVVERALAVPGAGRMLASAAASGDVPVVAALAALAASAVALTAGAASLVARRADPRLAGSGGVA